jgi:polyphosphate kinase
VADHQKLLNRELSWLEFNARVLEEARDPTVPLLERLKFLAICSSNLDEFFMVRVGGLRQLQDEGKDVRSADGRTVNAQLADISERTRQLVADQYGCYHEELKPALAKAGIAPTTMDELTSKQQEQVERLFRRDLQPVLSPVAVEASSSFRWLPGLSLVLLARLKPTEDAPRKNRFALIRLPRSYARFIPLTDTNIYQYVLLEDVVQHFVAELFPGETVAECVPFRITRNADLAIREDKASDLLSQMREVLDARKSGACVRLETEERISKTSLSFLQSSLHIADEHTYQIPGPVDLSAYRAFLKLRGFESLKDKPFVPQASPDIAPDASMFEVISRKDLLLFHPYDSFEPVVRFVEQAAADPDVLAIKQILYRTNADSRIVAALTNAAQKGKQVTVLVELKARFDEARNIEWAQALERAGADVIYGLKYLKVHAKVCLIVRREAAGLRRYAHFATGNYNEVTAALYSDIGLFTCHEDFVNDATAFFNAITGYSQPVRYRKLEAAPHGILPRLLELIETETEAAKQGHPARIIAKCNALVHQAIIDALYRASQAGVKIFLNIRGICCLRPVVPGLSENITVTSLVDRYLEHSRIFYFHHHGDPLVFISSADWMPRNLDRRVELLIPVEDQACKERLISILDTFTGDNVKSRRLLPDGRYERVTPGKREPKVRAQVTFQERAIEASKQAEKSLYTVFEPQRPARST